MDSSAADRIVLVAGPGPEILAVLLLLAIGIAGLAVGVVMARGGRVEAWSLPALFGLLILFAGVALWHLPTSLVLDRNGVDLRFWTLKDHRDWDDIRAVEAKSGRFGVWIRVTGKPAADSAWFSIWSPRAGFFAGGIEIDERQLGMRIDAWRLAGAR